jgi:hypothetical protein
MRAKLAIVTWIIMFASFGWGKTAKHREITGAMR